MNMKTVTTLLLDHPTDVETPRGMENTNRIIFDIAGWYRLPDLTIAANLLSEKESDVNPKEFVGTTAEEIDLKPVRQLREFEWEFLLLALALAVVFFELFYIKLRGDV